MTILAPYRVHQATQTSGTGTYALLTASGQFEAFNARYGNGQAVPYCVTDNISGFEIGKGTLTTGSPDQISRDTILLSSNSNAAVAWASGVTKDIFAWEGASALYPQIFTSTKTLDVTDCGNVSIYTGATSGQLNLPSISAVPSGWTTSYANFGTGSVTLQASGADTIMGSGTQVVTRLQAGDLVPSASGWIINGNYAAQQANVAITGGSISGVSLGVTGATVSGTIFGGTSSGTLGGSGLTLGGFIGASETVTGTAYTIGAGDIGQSLIFTAAGAVAVTLPNNLGVGCAFAAVQSGLGQVTFSGASGASLVSAHSYTSTYGQYAAVTLMVISNAGGASGVWGLFGDGAT